jgi:hypothetical protein
LEKVTSGRPSSANALSTTARNCSVSVAFSLALQIRSPKRSVSSIRVSGRHAIATRWPAASNCSATARPMPEQDPVMNHVFATATPFAHASCRYRLALLPAESAGAISKCAVHALAFEARRARPRASGWFGQRVVRESVESARSYRCQRCSTRGCEARAEESPPD